MRRLSILFAIFFSFFLEGLAAGEVRRSDSLDENSRNVSEAYFLYQKQQVDSLEKLQILNDLKMAVGNAKMINELEAKLRMIEREDSVRRLRLNERIDFLKKNVKGVPVVPFQDTLFLIHAKIGSYSPSDRAANIARNIVNLYEDPLFIADSLKLQQTEDGTEICYTNGVVVMLVTKIDAMYYGKEASQLAEEYLVIVRKAIVSELEEMSLTNMLLKIGKVALILGGLILLIMLINKAFRYFRGFITSHRERYLKGLTINKIKLFSPEQLELVITRVNGLIRILVILLAVYLSLPLLFSIFPETETWAGMLINWVIEPAKKALHGIVAFLPNLFTILVIWLIFRYAIRGIRYFVVQIEKGEIHLGGFHADWAQPTFRMLKFLLYAFMLVLIFPYLPGSSSPAFQGVSVFIGILFSLGSSSAISNMVAGLVITYMRPFKIGDRVKIGDITGDIIEKTTLVTRIRTPKNEDVTVPNSAILSSNTINYSSNAQIPGSGLIIHTTVTIGYDAPWRDVHRVLIEAANRTEFILKDPAPFVLQTSLEDFYVAYQLNGYTKESGRLATVYSQLHQNIQDSFNEAGIEIMSPHYRAQRDGNTTTVPANYLPDDYQAPRFRVE